MITIWKLKVPRCNRSAAQILGEYNQRIRDGRAHSQEVKLLLRIATGEPAAPRSAFSPSHSRSFGKRPSSPRARTKSAILKPSKPMTWSSRSAPAAPEDLPRRGHGRYRLLSKQVNRIILARPAVEAGERLGFLPGTLQEKVDPYMRPLYDALQTSSISTGQNFLEKVSSQ